MNKTVKIEEINNGFVVTYNDNQTSYVFRSVDDLVMLVDIGKKFLKRTLEVKPK